MCPSYPSFYRMLNFKYLNKGGAGSRERKGKYSPKLEMTDHVGYIQALNELTFTDLSQRLGQPVSWSRINNLYPNTSPFAYNKKLFFICSLHSLLY